MPCKVPPIRIGAACQPCTEREGLAALARVNSAGTSIICFYMFSRDFHDLRQNKTRRFRKENSFVLYLCGRDEGGHE